MNIKISQNGVEIGEWTIVAIIAFVLILLVAAILKRTLAKNRFNEATKKAWDYLLSVDAKFTEIKEPDRTWINKTKQYMKGAEMSQAYASEVIALVAQIQGMSRLEVDRELLDWAGRMSEWYDEWSDLYHEWSTHCCNIEQFNRVHTGFVRDIVAVLDGLIRLDPFAPTKELVCAQNQLSSAKDELDKQTKKLIGKREALLAELNPLREIYTSRWNWPVNEHQK